MDENQLFAGDGHDNNSDTEIQDLEFNFELINDVAWAIRYLEGFEQNFGDLIDHLVTIAKYMKNKEFFYKKSIGTLNDQLSASQVENRRLLYQLNQQT